MSRLVTRLPRDTDDGAEHNTILSGTIQGKFNTLCMLYMSKLLQDMFNSYQNDDTLKLKFEA